MSLVTIYALFFDDIRIIALQKDQDDIAYTVACIVFIIFSLELFLHSISDPEYFLSFFFWLDLISVLSLIPDIGWIT
jgi:hypothetical protein